MTILSSLSKKITSIFCLVLLFISQNLFAQMFSLSSLSEGVVGEVQTTTVKPKETLAQIARKYDTGYTALQEANPGIDPQHLKAGSILIIPNQFVLPNAPREGIVVNLAEMRIYYYPKGTHEVFTYPIGIGREGEDTPLGVLQIIEHIPNPTWHVPESIRRMRAAQGVYLPKSVPPGPDNPLGNYAMRLSNFTYLMHGTNDPLGGIGRRSSSGCLRLYPEDIDPLFHMVANGTPVYIINEPYKAGWSADGHLYIESHVALEQKSDQAAEDATKIMQVIRSVAKDKSVEIDWDKALQISGETQGLPQSILKN